MSLLLLLKANPTTDTEEIPQVGASYSPIRRVRLKPKPKKKSYAQILAEELAKQFDKYGRTLPVEAKAETQVEAPKPVPVREVTRPVQQAAQAIIQSVEPRYVSLTADLVAFNEKFSREAEAQKLQAMQQALAHLEQQTRARKAIEALAKQQEEEDEELMMIAFII